MRGVWMVCPVLFAVYVPSCRTPVVQPSPPGVGVHISELWERLRNLAESDLHFGGGYDSAPTARFIRELQAWIERGHQLTASAGEPRHGEQAP
jgi:hypothetical protein